MILVIDDDREFPTVAHFDGAVYVKSSDEAFDLLFNKDCSFDEIWFDHDLVGEDTSRPVALWLCCQAFEERPYPVSKIYVHSMNGPGADWLVKSLQQYYDVTRVMLPNAVILGEREPDGYSI